MGEIRERLREAMSPGWDFVYEGKYDLQDDIIEDVIAIVREALLSDEAVSAGNKMCPDYSQDTDAGDVVTAMLDAAFGDQQSRHAPCGTLRKCKAPSR